MKTCRVPGCTREAITRGFCKSHYERWRKHGDSAAHTPLGPHIPGHLCSVESCSKRVESADLCVGHLRRQQKYGDPLAHIPLRPKSLPIAERFWRHVDQSGGPAACWPWMANKTQSGHGLFRVSQHDQWPEKSHVAHRIAYILVYGPIPSGLEIDHTCHTKDCPFPGPRCLHRACCNPAHLEAVTHAENARRGNGAKSLPRAVEARVAKQLHATHCPHGHPWSAVNTYIYPNGRRMCRACRLNWQHRRHTQRLST